MFSSLRKHHRLHAVFLLVVMGVSFGFSQIAHASMMQEHKHGQTSVCVDGGCLEDERECLDQCLQKMEEQEEDVAIVRLKYDNEFSSVEMNDFFVVETFKSIEKPSELTRGPPALVWISSIIRIE